MKIFILTWVVLVVCSLSAAFDPLDPTRNITVRWDIMSWTADGYVAVVTMNNFQMYRHIQTPGWTLGWTWAKKEVIWSMVGAQTTEQGDCSKFKANVPHCCKKNPTVVDLLPGVPYNQQFSNCCKDGVVAAWGRGRMGSRPLRFSLGFPGQRWNVRDDKQDSQTTEEFHSFRPWTRVYMWTCKDCSSNYFSHS